MKFYSYELLQSKIAQNNIVGIVIVGILLLVLLFSLIKYYKNRQDTKYRELSIILVLGTILAVTIGIGNLFVKHDVAYYRVISSKKKIVTY